MVNPSPEARMDESRQGNVERVDYDAVIVGASLAGCATAIALGRSGAHVALVEKRPDPAAFKRVCSHFIQASAAPALDRLGLLEPIVEAGGVRTTMRAWTPWGWIETPAAEAREGVNLRRELLDPMVREAAVATPGVELMLGRSAERLVREGDTVRGVVVRDPDGAERTLSAQLVVGADGRDSRIAELGAVKTKTSRHGRFAYGAYFDGPPAAAGGASSIWMLDPNWAAAFPTDSGLTFYAAMPTKDRLPEFRRDPEGALISFVGSVPEAPPIGVSRLVSPVLGKIEMPNKVRVPVAPGLALVGDAAMAVDPLFGVGCGWAFQSGEWLANSVAPALAGEEPLHDGLSRYRRQHRRALRGHATMINEYASGRKMQPGEKLIFSAGARDPRMAERFEAFGTRSIGPARFFATAIPRAIAVNTRHALASRGQRPAPRPGGHSASHQS
ncbi:MAG TPA: NAD(P)/FAD-dependent oxidoreductase [Solirubrobacterales bacterium]|nr:NAD(P)/FAD-dependent oxidoreductase [Solirubrobacterales bacterium]